MANIIIYPTGSTLNTNPHIIFSGTGVDYTIEIDTTGDLIFKSSTDIFKIVDSTSPLLLPGEVNVVNSELYVGTTMVVNSSGDWVGDTHNLKGYKGLKGGQGPTGTKGNTGIKGQSGAKGLEGRKVKKVLMDHKDQQVDKVQQVMILKKVKKVF